MFGIGRFYQEPDPTKLYESEDPPPFVPSRMKTVRWKSDPTGSGNIGNVDFNVEHESHHIEAEIDNDFTTSGNRKRREKNPYWEEEFELPEPELIYNSDSLLNKILRRSALISILATFFLQSLPTNLHVQPPHSI